MAAAESRFAIATACCLLASAGCLAVAVSERKAAATLEAERAIHPPGANEQMFLQSEPVPRQGLGVLLPPIGRSAELLQTLFDVAAQTGIKLDEGDYRLRATRDPQVMQLSVSMPLRADYQHIQGFLASALYQLPNLGLESLQLQREKPETADLDAKLQLVLYFSARKRAD